MGDHRVKKLSTKKVEDTMALRWARVVNRGAEARKSYDVQILQRAEKIRCHDLQREVQNLRKLLVKLNITSGYLDKDIPAK